MAVLTRLSQMAFRPGWTPGVRALIELTLLPPATVLGERYELRARRLPAVPSSDRYKPSRNSWLQPCHHVCLTAIARGGKQPVQWTSASVPDPRWPRCA